jgi:hypothetical protein
MFSIAPRWRKDVKRCISGPRGRKGDTLGISVLALTAPVIVLNARRSRRVRTRTPTAQVFVCRMLRFSDSTTGAPFIATLKSRHFTALDHLADGRLMKLQKIRRFFDGPYFVQRSTVLDPLVFGLTSTSAAFAFQLCRTVAA